MDAGGPAISGQDILIVSHPMRKLIIIGCFTPWRLVSWFIGVCKSFRLLHASSVHCRRGSSYERRKAATDIVMIHHRS